MDKLLINKNTANPSIEHECYIALIDYLFDVQTTTFAELHAIFLADDSPYNRKDLLVKLSNLLRSGHIQIKADVKNKQLNFVISWVKGDGNAH